MGSVKRRRRRYVAMNAVSATTRQAAYQQQRVVRTQAIERTLQQILFRVRSSDSNGNSHQRKYHRAPEDHGENHSAAGASAKRMPISCVRRRTE